MFEITPITLEFAIGPQPTAKDFAAVRSAGYAAVLNVRPDDEDGNYDEKKPFVSGSRQASFSRLVGISYIWRHVFGCHYCDVAHDG